MGKWSKVFGVLLLFVSVSAWSLDFDDEIRRQERSVKVGYQAPPKTMASFLKHYPECRPLIGSERLKCNQAIAKERYHAYFQEWKQRTRRVVSSAETDSLAVQLEKRSQ